MNETLVLHNTTTDEVYAVIPYKGAAIVKNGYNLAVYNDSEPVFWEEKGKIYLDVDKTILHSGWMNE